MNSIHTIERPEGALRRRLRGRFATFAALALAAVFSPGCATQQALQDYQDEIITLRDENSTLKSQKLELERQVGAYQAQMSQLDRQLQEASSPQAAPNFPELTGQGIDVSMRGQDIVISIPAGITFASGSATLSSGGQDAVRSVANRLKSEFSSATYWIEGHTDTDVPTKSKFKTNRELSIERARSVHGFLVEQCGIPDAKCVVAGHGEYQPVADNTSAAGKARNRRVEIIVHRGA
ncbi:MAG: OmpA family protein [Planctomycetota bacterium]